jgi:lipopolysaccharide export system protein LptA
MKPLLLGLCVLALTVGANGQEGSLSVHIRSAAVLLTASQFQQDVRTRVLPTGFDETYAVVVAKGVEIRMGSAVLRADEAEITNGAAGEPSNIQLRGNVRLSGTLEIARTLIR